MVLAATSLSPMCAFQDSIITMIFGVGAAIAAFPPVMDFCVGLLGRKGAVIFGGFIFCLGATIQALVTWWRYSTGSGNSGRYGR